MENRSDYLSLHSREKTPEKGYCPHCGDLLAQTGREIAGNEVFECLGDNCEAQYLMITPANFQELHKPKNKNHPQRREHVNLVTGRIDKRDMPESIHPLMVWY